MNATSKQKETQTYIRSQMQATTFQGMRMPTLLEFLAEYTQRSPSKSGVAPVGRTP